MAPGDAAPKQITHVFDYLGRDIALGAQEAITWKGADGVTIEGLVTYPVDYQAGQKYPLAVMTHGGPQAADKYGIGSMAYEIQVLAGKGYVSLQPNYRGSTGYGDAFLRDMVGHYFQNAHLDVMAGVDELIRRGVADPDRMVKMGWSAGGHMTNKIITITDRFKAASAGAGVAQWMSMYAQSDIRSFRTPWFGGTPWQANAPIDAYWNNSPLKDVANVKTPTLFFVGEQDPRVPMPQSLEMYRALKSNGVPTHLYVAPREPHGWGELRHQLSKLNAEIEWFEKYATKRPFTPERAPGDEKKEPRPAPTSAVGVHRVLFVVEMAASRIAARRPSPPRCWRRRFGPRASAGAKADVARSISRACSGSPAAPQLSPDGRTLVYGLSVTDWKLGRLVYHLWRQDVAGGAPVQLTFSEAATSRCIALVARRQDDPVHARRPDLADPGRRRRAARADEARDAASSAPQWSPDGTVGLLHRRATRRPPTIASARACATMCIRSTRRIRQRQLWKIVVSTGAETQLTSGDSTVKSYSAVGRRQADGGAARADAGRHGRVPRRSLGDGRRRRERARPDQQRHRREVARHLARRHAGAVPRRHQRALRVLLPDQPVRRAARRAARRGSRRRTSSTRSIRRCGRPTASRSSPPSTWACTPSSSASTSRARRAQQLTDGAHFIPPGWIGRCRAPDKIVFQIDEPTRFGEVWTLPMTRRPRRRRRA